MINTPFLPKLAGNIRHMYTKSNKLILAFFIALALISCESSPKNSEIKSDTVDNQNDASQNGQSYGTVDGQEVKQYTLSNASGMVVKIITVSYTHLTLPTILRV